MGNSIEDKNDKDRYASRVVACGHGSPTNGSDESCGNDSNDINSDGAINGNDGPEVFTLADCNLVGWEEVVTV